MVGVARLRSHAVDPIAHIEVISARNGLVFLEFHLQVDRLVAEIVQLRLQLRRERGVVRLQRRDIAAGVVQTVLKALDVDIGGVLRVCGSSDAANEQRREDEENSTVHTLHDDPRKDSIR